MNISDRTFVKDPSSGELMPLMVNTLIMSAVVSDGHDKPFCTTAITIIDNFKNALGDTDNR